MAMRRLLALVAGSLVCLASSGFAARGASVARGSLAAFGSVWLDGQPVPSAAVVFAGDVVRTGANSAARVDFRGGVSATLAANAEIALGAGPGREAVAVRRGVVAVRSAGPQPARVSVLGASVVVEASSDEPALPALCRIAADSHSALVMADRGQVEIRGAGRPLVLAAGQYAALGAPEGQAQPSSSQAPSQAPKPPAPRAEPSQTEHPSQTQHPSAEAPSKETVQQEVSTRLRGAVAGKVNRYQPRALALHRGESGEVPLRLGELLSVGDSIRTLRHGRVEVKLLSGPVFSIGSGAQVRVTKFDAPAEQSEVELRAGALSGEVSSLANPGAQFRVVTPAAAVVTGGAVFLVEAGPRATRVCSAEGDLAVASSERAVKGTLALHSGECATVRFGEAPAPTRQGAARVRRQREATTVLGPTADEVGQPVTGATPVMTEGRARALRIAALAGPVAGEAAVVVIMVGDTASELAAANRTLDAAEAEIAAANAALAQIEAEMKQYASPSSPP